LEMVSMLVIGLFMFVRLQDLHNNCICN